MCHWVTSVQTLPSQ
uniref:Uncharacterized protein n=1 Tax=Anguilla anguilla TaxID=7936 RepID=A0A0E9VVC3_ANGAN